MISVGCIDWDHPATRDELRRDAELDAFIARVQKEREARGLPAKVKVQVRP
jgi:hypothetical protein